MRIPLEVQLMRDWSPRSRPSPGELLLGESTPSFVKLFPGAAAMGTEEMLAIIEDATRWDMSWCRAIVSFRIDGIQFAEPRPTSIYLGPSPEWSGIVHFPRMATGRNKLLSGVHSMLLRCVQNAPVSVA
jgi:hypothetical protein